MNYGGVVDMQTHGQVIGGGQYQGQQQHGDILMGGCTGDQQHHQQTVGPMTAMTTGYGGWGVGAPGMVGQYAYPGGHVAHAQQVTGDVGGQGVQQGAMGVGQPPVQGGLVSNPPPQHGGLGPGGGQIPTNSMSGGTGAVVGEHSLDNAGPGGGQGVKEYMHMVDTKGGQNEAMKPGSGDQTIPLATDIPEGMGSAQTQGPDFQNMPTATPQSWSRSGGVSGGPCRAKSHRGPGQPEDWSGDNRGIARTASTAEGIDEGRWTKEWQEVRRRLQRTNGGHGEGGGRAGEPERQSMRAASYEADSGGGISFPQMPPYTQDSGVGLHGGADDGCSGPPATQLSQLSMVTTHCDSVGSAGGSHGMGTPPKTVFEESQSSNLGGGSCVSDSVTQIQAEVADELRTRDEDL